MRARYNTFTTGQLLAVCFGIGVVISLWWYKAYFQSGFPETVDCDLNLGICDVETGRGRVALAITPRPIRPLKPLQAVVTLQGFEAEQVELLFTGVDVDMGRLFYPLKQASEDRFEGLVSLSICAQSRMTWQVLVIIDRTLQLPFRFESEYKSQFSIIE
jgi:hypothetical protein